MRAAGYRTPRRIPGAWLPMVTVLAMLLVGSVGGVTAAPTRPTTATTILAVTQNPAVVTPLNSMTVSAQLSSSANLRLVYFTFCQLDPPYVCYNPVTMTASSGNWYTGTTKQISMYYELGVGKRAGYNITIVYTDNSTSTEPQATSHYANLSIAQSQTGEYMFEITIANPVYNLTGHVLDAAKGTPVTGATVTATSTGTPVSATTDGNGAYRLPGLANGTYSISASSPGYHSQTSSVKIAGKDQVQDLRLSNSATGPGNGTTGPGGSKAGFFSTTSGVETLAVVGAIVAVGVIAALAMVIRKRGRIPPTAPPPASQDAASAPSSPPG